MRIRHSALKHGISPEDSRFAATTGCKFSAPLDEAHPQRELRLGLDRHLRPLELVVLRWDDGTDEIIHAMKCRKQYLELFE